MFQNQRNTEVNASMSSDTVETYNTEIDELVEANVVIRSQCFFQHAMNSCRGTCLEPCCCFDVSLFDGFLTIKYNMQRMLHKMEEKNTAQLRKYT